MRRTRFWLAAAAAALAAGPVLAAGWEMKVSDEGAVEVLYEHAPLVTANYCFWGADWKWAGAAMKVGEADGDSTPVSGAVEALGLTIDARIRSPSANTLVYTYTLDASRDLGGIIGGGLEFQLRLGSPALPKGAGEPVLLPDHTGWRWPVAGGGAITVAFKGPVANVYFERGQKNKVRAMLVGEAVEKGTRRIEMTVTLPEGGRVVPSVAQRYGRPDTSTWFAGAMAWDASPVDLSFLNAADRPAGRRGFVRAKGDALVWADGTPARFWGGNIAAYAIFTDKEVIRQQARRIACLGYNLMRFHHHDSMGWVGRTVIDKTRDDSQHLDPEVMDRLDFWIKCLKDEGVYVWLDLHVGRTFKKGDDLGEGADEILKRGGEIKGFCYFNERVRRLMKEFNAAYLNHVNPYTRLAYKDDPAVMGLLITNENDLTHHFGNLMLGDKGNPVHNRVFMAEVKAFSAKTGLPPDETAKTWVPGPSKIMLNEYEHRFNADVLAHLATLGVKVPVATTQYWGNEALHSLPALTDSGIIDIHSYGGEEALSKNPNVDANFIPWIGAGQIEGYPAAVTEWNVPWPARDRCTAPLYVAAIAALQGWDAPMIYNYSQDVFQRPTRPSTWSTYFDPAITGMMPAAAMAFRQGHVAPARKSYCLKLSRDQVYGQDLSPTTSRAVRTLVEQSRLAIGLPDVKELDWDRETKVGPGVEVLADPDRGFLAPDATAVESDTGELARDWVRGIQTVDTPRTQAVAGWVGGQDIQLKDVRFAIAVPKAAVAVTSLDGEPIATSRRMLISAVARAVANPDKASAYLSEPVVGTLTIRGRAAGLRLVPLSADGKEGDPVALDARDGAGVVRLPTDKGTHWFLLTAGGE